MNRPRESAQECREAPSGVEAGQGQGQGAESAKGAPITSHARKDMEAALFMAQKQHAALAAEIEALKAALGRVSG